MPGTIAQFIIYNFKKRETKAEKHNKKRETKAKKYNKKRENILT